MVESNTHWKILLVVSFVVLLGAVVQRYLFGYSSVDATCGMLFFAVEFVVVVLQALSPGDAD